METEQLVSGDDGGIPLLGDKNFSVFGILWLMRPLVVYPALWLLKLSSLILWPLLRVLDWLAYPFIRLAQGLYVIALLPFTIFTKFEAILTYLLAAIIVGAVAGTVLYILSSATGRIFNLDESSNTKTTTLRSTQKESGRSIAEYRAARRLKKKKKRVEKQVQSPREEKMFRDMLSKASGNESIGFSGGKDDGNLSPGTLPLSTQTILEEDDSSSFE